jgi:hypothetical protein
MRANLLPVIFYNLSISPLFLLTTGFPNPANDIQLIERIRLTKALHKTEKKLFYTIPSLSLF